MTTPDATVTQESLAEQLQAMHGETVFLSPGGRAAAIDWTSLRIDEEADGVLTATASSLPGEGEEAVELTLTVDADGQVTLLDEVEETEEAGPEEADGASEDKPGNEPDDGPSAEDSNAPADGGAEVTDESAADGANDGANDESADAEPEDEDSGSAAEAEEPVAAVRPQRPAGPAPQQAQPQAPQPQVPQVPQQSRPDQPRPTPTPQQPSAPTAPEQFGAGQFGTEQSGTEQPAQRPPGRPAGQPAGSSTGQLPETLPDYTPDQLTAAYGNRWFPFEGRYFVIDWQTWDVDNRLPDAIGSYVDARDPEDAPHRLYVWLNLLTGPEIVQVTPAEPEPDEDEEPSADDMVDQYQPYAFSFKGTDFIIDWSTWDPDQRTDDGWLGSSMDAIDRDDNHYTVYVWFHRTTTPMIVAAEAEETKETDKTDEPPDPAAQARSRFDDELCQQLHDRWSADGKVFTDAAGRAYDVSAWVDGGYDASFEFAGFDESALYATLAALTADEPSRPVLLHLRITDPDSILVEREESR